MITVLGNMITAKTKTLEAVFDCGVLVSLSAKNGATHLKTGLDAAEGLELVYSQGETVPVTRTGWGTVESVSLSDTSAQVLLHAWDAEGVVMISEDEETGALLIEPEAYSARSGVTGCRYTLSGIAEGLRIATSVYQGIDMELDDPILKKRYFAWPMYWEAALAIFHNGENGFWVHTEDTAFRYKGLYTGAGADGRDVGFVTEAYGPAHANLSAGGVVWRLNVFEGTWREPAKEYKAWLYRAYSLGEREKARAPWMNDIKMGISWCPTNLALLDALAAKTDPKKVLLHLPNWRVYKYDQNYPDFTPSKEGIAFVKRATELGFHVMPHANVNDMDPSMPEYRLVGDFKYRQFESGRFLGWGWHEGRVLGVPSANKALAENRDKNVMVKIHPGLAMWRAILADRVKKAHLALGRETDIMFLDVTLVSLNMENCLVDSMTSSEGMKRILDHVATVDGGIALGGEGLNEITMQSLTFAQAHLFDSHQGSAGALARCGGCDLNTLLFGSLCRTIGYSGLDGASEGTRLRMRIHEEHGAIPTITISGPDEITNPNDAVRAVLEGAR